MIIELVGLPASGKSTFVRDFLQEKGFTRVLIKTKKELLYLNFIFILKHPFFSLYTIWLIFIHSTSIALFYYKFMNTFLHHNARHEKAKKIKKAVIDEGFTQNVLSIFDTQVPQRQIEKYLKYAPRTDKVFVFEARTKTIQKRARERGFLARDAFYSQREQNTWLAAIQTNLNTLKEALKGQNISFEVVNSESKDRLFSATKQL